MSMDDKLNDAFNHPAVEEYFEHVRRELVPMLNKSTVTMTLVPPEGSHDLKYAVELGLMIMMDKPIIVLAVEGRPIPPKLRAVADEVVEVSSLNDVETSMKISQAMARIADALPA